MMMSMIEKHFPTIDFNITGDQGIGPLHTAVIQFDVDMLEHLLQQDHIDVNYRNVINETPLLLCLRQSSNQMQQLTQSQANLDIASLLRRQVEIARKLIENGADINARNWLSQTALHCAVENNNYEGVCMLLYYGIDVSSLCSLKRTAFISALRNNYLDLAEVLFDYYADFSDIDVHGSTALYWAVKNKSPLASKVLETGVDVNCVPESELEKNLLMVSFRNDNVDLFKLIWQKFDHRLLLEETKPFLEVVINDYSLKRSVSDWVEYMYLILESPIAFDLLDHYKREIMKYDYDERNFQILLYKLIDLKVKASDRIGIIASCLSLGLQASIDDINITFQHYGFGKELELFIYGTDVYDWRSSVDLLCLVPLYIFAQEGEVSLWRLEGLLWGQFSYYDSKSKEQTGIFVHSLGFFALPLFIRLELQSYMQASKHRNQIIHDRLNNVPELPSLLELARKGARQYIKQKYRVYQPYHMHDAVKSLNLPQRIRDIILFKIPIYK